MKWKPILLSSVIKSWTSSTFYILWRPIIKYYFAEGRVITSLYHYPLLLRLIRKLWAGCCCSVVVVGLLWWETESVCCWLSGRRHYDTPHTMRRTGEDRTLVTKHLTPDRTLSQVSGEKCREVRGDTPPGHSFSLSPLHLQDQEISSTRGNQLPAHPCQHRHQALCYKRYQNEDNSIRNYPVFQMICKMKMFLERLNEWC